MHEMSFLRCSLRTSSKLSSSGSEAVPYVSQNVVANSALFDKFSGKNHKIGRLLFKQSFRYFYLSCSSYNFIFSI